MCNRRSWRRPLQSRWQSLYPNVCSRKLDTYKANVLYAWTNRGSRMRCTVSTARVDAILHRDIVDTSQSVFSHNCFGPCSSAPCAHMFCRDCLLSEFQQQLVRSNKTVKKEGTSNEMKVEGGLCPVCNDYVKSSTIIQIKKSEKGELISKYLNLSPSEEKENTPNASTEALPRRDVVARETLKSALNGAGSSKLDAVLAELDRVWTSDPGSKVLVFSQYLGFLDIVGRALENIGVACFRIDGKMSLKERVAMIGKFNKKKSKRATAFQEEGVCLRGSVFLVSMKAGGVGLNLVAASSEFRA